MPYNPRRHTIKMRCNRGGGSKRAATLGLLRCFPWVAGGPSAYRVLSSPRLCPDERTWGPSQARSLSAEDLPSRAQVPTQPLEIKTRAHKRKENRRDVGLDLPEGLCCNFLHHWKKKKITSSNKDNSSTAYWNVTSKFALVLFLRTLGNSLLPPPPLVIFFL